MQARHSFFSENINAHHEENIQNVHNEVSAEKNEAMNTFNAKVQEKMAQVKESYKAKIVAASKEVESAKASKYQLLGRTSYYSMRYHIDV